MKRFFGAFLALLFLLLPVRAEELQPPTPGEGVFQSGAMEGPQTIPRPAPVPEPPAWAAAPEKAAYVLSRTVLEEAGAAVEGLELPVERLLMLHDYLVSAGRVPREDSAAAYQALLAEYVPQVPCRLIRTRAGDHAWNLVQLDGNWYHVDVALDTPANQPGRCFHTYFLVSDGVLRWHEHPEWDQSLYPACTDETYQENYQYAYSSHAFTRRDGRFLYLRDNGDGAVEGMSFTAQLFETDSLLREGRGPERALGVLSECGALWMGDCLYYITYTLKPEMSYCLMIYDRTSGAVAQGPVFDLPRDAGIGVLHDAPSGEVRAVSTKDASVFAALPALSRLPSSWRESAESIELLELEPQLSPEGLAAVSWGFTVNVPEDLTLWAAFYRDGRLTDLRSARVESRHPWESDTSLKLAWLDLENLPEYDEARILLTGQNVIAAASSADARL